jgi:hypothetical protein
MKKAIFPLAVLFAASVFSGCAHQNTRTGSRTNVLGGLVQVERGAYQPAAAATIDVNTNELIGNMGKPSGTQVKLLWGAITANDY